MIVEIAKKKIKAYSMRCNHELHFQPCSRHMYSMPSNILRRINRSLLDRIYMGSIRQCSLWYRKDRHYNIDCRNHKLAGARICWHQLSQLHRKWSFYHGLNNIWILKPGCHKPGWFPCTPGRPTRCIWHDAWVLWFRTLVFQVFSYPFHTITHADIIVAAPC